MPRAASPALGPSTTNLTGRRPPLPDCPMNAPARSASRIEAEVSGTTPGSSRVFERLTAPSLGSWARSPPDVDWGPWLQADRWTCRLTVRSRGPARLPPGTCQRRGKARGARFKEWGQKPPAGLTAFLEDGAAQPDWLRGQHRARRDPHRGPTAENCPRPAVPCLPRRGRRPCAPRTTRWRRSRSAGVTWERPPPGRHGRTSAQTRLRWRMTPADPGDGKPLVRSLRCPAGCCLR